MRADIRNYHGYAPNWWDTKWRDNGGMFLVDPTVRLNLGIWRTAKAEYSYINDISTSDLNVLAVRLSQEILRLTTMSTTKRIIRAETWLAKISKVLATRS